VVNHEYAGVAGRASRPQERSQVLALRGAQAAGGKSRRGRMAAVDGDKGHGAAELKAWPGAFRVGQVGRPEARQESLGAAWDVDVMVAGDHAYPVPSPKALKPGQGLTQLMFMANVGKVSRNTPMLRRFPPGRADHRIKGGALMDEPSLTTPGQPTQQPLIPQGEGPDVA
jgi:hypothetical protein